MTLKEAIKHCEEVAKQNEEDAVVYSNCKKHMKNLFEIGISENAENKCRKCAEEHRQLAEWLKELVKYRQAFGHIEQRAAGVVIYKGQVFKSFDDDLVLKTQDKNGMCSFYGFREVGETDGKM